MRVPCTLTSIDVDGISIINIEMISSTNFAEREKKRFFLEILKDNKSIFFRFELFMFA